MPAIVHPKWRRLKIEAGAILKPYSRCLSRVFCIFWTIGLLFSGFCIPHARAETPVVLQLKWYPQFQFAGYYAALEKGFYKHAGLDVEIRHYEKNLEMVEEVLSGRADFSVAGSEILLQRLAGKPVQVGAVIFQHSPSILLSLTGMGITSPHNLVGKRLMISEKGEMDIWAMLLNEGISRDQIIPAQPLTWDIEDLISGKVQAFAAYATNTPFLLAERGIPYISMVPRTYGVDFYGDCLFTSEDFIRENPNTAGSFIRASLEGWNYALENTEELVDLILSRYSSSKSRDHLLFEAGIMQELILPRLIQLGHINPGRWRHIAETYVQLGMASPGYDLEGFVFIPEAPVEPGWVARNFWIIAAVLAAVLLLAGWLAFFNRRLRLVVRDRTAELVQVNRTLIREVEERRKAEQMLQTYQEHLEDLVRRRTEKLSETHLALSREMEDKKEVQKAYALSEQRLRQLIHNIQAAVILLAADSTILSMNPMAQSLLGVSESEMLGKTTAESPWRMVGEGGGALSENEYPVAIVLQSKKAASGLVRGILRKDLFEPLWITVGANPLFDTKGDVDRIIVTFMNISKRKKAEEALLAAKVEAEAASAAKSNFLTSMSHELRTPLNAIIGFADVLKDPYFGPLNTEQIKFVSDILESGRDLLRMIDEILDITDIMAKPSENKRTPVYSGFLIKNMVASFKRDMDRLNQVVELDIPRELEDRPLKIDQDKTLRVLEHLIGNAVKFTPENGRIRISVETTDHFLVVRVEDTGVGIEAEHLENLFQDFFQISSGIRDKTPGAGLGLPIAKRLVDAMGGKIWAESEGSGCGSRFIFQIPLE